MKKNAEKERLIRISAEIRALLQEMEPLRKEFEKFMEEKETASWSTFDMRILGSIFHDFYTGIEKIFLRIAKELNGGVPAGEDWHAQLLRDMTLELPKIRPPVISQELYADLKEFLGFRHVFRNVYGYLLDEVRMRNLAEKFKSVFEKATREIELFAEFLEKS